ncbi:hypothetical protein CS063_14415 [Sporanaerobium hydrogeniformans]|uniref:Uncharacterized protein n=1 Tax=Sporanaerobium hydrogeniformans TaxID=3072179 RepID=A0AC61D9K4_9FIRM|nr:HAD family phosphatase [Sporanaerobium hydrogeniformans]PHV69687.1 hypothetical protein CS063_14415 [Sporanaerobium hydrogeniformans]
MIKTVVFDMDGILFDTERLVGEVWKQIAIEQELKDIEKVLMDCIGRSYEDTRVVFQYYYGKSFGFECFRKQARELFFNSIKERGIPIKKGVRELLAYLKGNGYKIGLASSSKKVDILSHLKEAGIAEYFQVIVSGDRVKHSKPNPEIYQLACKELGVIPSEAFCIEDSLNGVRAGSSAGLKVIMVPDLVEPTGEILELVHKKFDSLLEVKSYLEEYIEKL